ncbi:G protein-coupled receptor kinase 7 [Heterocephalus glaber]|uniref:G protein-coupled receptor kinase n=1 Tax=Heterocephalus glaber TaxID=10181 RepID=G5AZ61_HETGA|nr:G protein-coupled receptor kinase 7 [Heterocephalus glaber]
MGFLQEQPFRDFLASPFYDKFLQWKLFEMQPISSKYFIEFRVLGKGGFGEVCAIQVKNTGNLRKGEQLFIVLLAYAFESKSHLCLVMTLMNGGDLKFHIYNVGTRGLALSRVVFYSAQMACGLLDLHSLGIVYRDLKPENVLLDDLGNCRLSDMGLAVQIQDDRPVTQRAGTNGYMATEILIEKVSYSYPVDWFAMGCSIYEMVVGRTPFKDYKEKISKEDLKQRTLKEEAMFQHENFTEEVKDICRLFLEKKPEQRLGSRKNSDDPRKHPFFNTINFPRLEAGLLEPPFVPDPYVIYAKDIDEIEDFSEEEILESGLFEELNDPNQPAGYGKDNSSKSDGVCYCELSPYQPESQLTWSPIVPALLKEAD